MLGRALLILAGLLLLGTAGFHASGGGAVAGWLGGERGLLLQTLWYLPGLDWAVVGLAFVGIGWRCTRRSAPLAWLLAAVPGGAAAAIAGTLGPAFVGAWLLAASALFAILGAIALPRPRAAPPKAEAPPPA